METSQTEYTAPIAAYLLSCLLALAIAAIIVFSVINYPVYQTTLAISLGIYSILLWRTPSLWLIIIPVLVPLLDLTPVSGRVFYGEFDLFVLATVAISLIRREPWLQPLKFSALTWLLLTLLIIWQLYTTLNGLLPVSTVNANSFTSYYSEYNALRIAKGFFGALLLLPALGQAIHRQQDVARIFSIGMLASLLAGVLVILWERSLFTGILNFDTPYRVTGLFSIMATGGAPIDAHLIMTIPFVYFLFLQKNTPYRVAGSALLLAALYGVAVTYSRTNYPALLLSGMVTAGIWFYQHRAILKKIALPQKKNMITTALVLTLFAIPVFSGQYIQNRFTTIIEDFQLRINHWQWSTQIMDQSLETTLLGMGKGAFPRTYLWQRPDGDMPSIASHRIDSNNSFIQMGKSHPGGDLFLRQRFAVNESGPYRLSIDLKPRTSKKTRLLIEVCERIIFQSYRECNWIGINTHSDSTRWETYNKNLNVSGLGVNHLLEPRPVEISILNRGMKNGINIDNVQIITPSGEKLLQNSGFEQGMDNWFLYSGDHLAWHVKNIWLDAYFEGGLLGLLALTLLIIAIFIKAVKRIQEQDQLVIPLASAFAGLMIVGLFDSLFDDPRIGLMFFLLVWVIFSRNVHAPHNRKLSP